MASKRKARIAANRRIGTHTPAFPLEHKLGCRGKSRSIRIGWKGTDGSNFPAREGDLWRHADRVTCGRPATWRRYRPGSLVPKSVPAEASLQGCLRAASH